MKLIWHWLILSIALFFTGYFMPSDISFSPIYITLVVGAVLLFVNIVIKPVLNLITLPLRILTLGIFPLILNGAFFYGLTFVIHGFYVRSLLAAIVGAVVVSLINWLLEKFM